MFRWIGLMVLAMHLGSITDRVNSGEPRVLGAAGRLDGVRIGPWYGGLLSLCRGNWALLHGESAVTCECTSNHSSHLQGAVLTAELWLMGLLNPGRWCQIIFFASHGCCVPLSSDFLGAHQGELDFFLSSRKICEAAVGKQGMTSFCKQRLGWEDTRAVFWRRAAGVGRLYMQPFSFLCMWPSSLCPSLPPHTSSVLWCPGEFGLHCGEQGPGSSRGLRAGVQSTSGLASSVFCVSAWILQQKIRGASRLNEARKTTLLCSQERQSKELKWKIKLWWSMTTFMFLSFVLNCKTLECDDFIWKQVAPLWQQYNSKWEFPFHAPDKGLVVFSCQCAEDGPAVCWWYWKQPNCLFKKLSNKETPKWNSFFSINFLLKDLKFDRAPWGVQCKGVEKLVIRQSCHCKLFLSRMRSSSSFGAQTGLGLRQFVTVPPCG